MLYYCAPMEGFTDAVYRRCHRQFFGGTGSANGAADRYFAPFVSPTQDNRLDPRMLRDLLPENNPDALPVPQLLCKSAAPFLWFAGELAAMGYREVNLNLGCPAGTVVAKGKGAGLLRDPAALDTLLYEIFAAAPPLAVSIKTRLGLTAPEEFDALLQIYRKYPLAELTIHPRVRAQFYRGRVQLPPFEQALQSCAYPVCYNGDLVTAADCTAFAAAHPALHAEMLGRGLLANPAVLRQVRGGAALTAPELAAFMAQLYEAYTLKFGSRKNAIRRMKGCWTYTLGLFGEHSALEKQLRHAEDHAAYTTAVNMLFARLPLRTDAVNVWQKIE